MPAKPAPMMTMSHVIFSLGLSCSAVRASPPPLLTCGKFVAINDDAKTGNDEVSPYGGVQSSIDASCMGRSHSARQISRNQRPVTVKDDRLSGRQRRSFKAWMSSLTMMDNEVGAVLRGLRWLLRPLRPSMSSVEWSVKVRISGELVTTSVAVSLQVGRRRSSRPLFVSVRYRRGHGDDLADRICSCPRAIDVPSREIAANASVGANRSEFRRSAS